MAAIAPRETIRIDMAGQFPPCSLLPLQDLSILYQLFQLGISMLDSLTAKQPGVKEEEENTEQKGRAAGPRRRGEAEGPDKPKWKLLLHQSQGSSFHPSPGTSRGVHAQRQSPWRCPLESMAVLSSPSLSPHPLCTNLTPPALQSCLCSASSHTACPHGWTQTWPQPPCPRDVFLCPIRPTLTQGGTA